MTDPCNECTSHKDHSRRIERLENHEDQRVKDIRNTYMLVVAAIIAMVFNILTTVITPKIGGPNDTGYRSRQSEHGVRTGSDYRGNRENSNTVKE